MSRITPGSMERQRTAAYQAVLTATDPGGHSPEIRTWDSHIALSRLLTTLQETALSDPGSRIMELTTSKTPEDVFVVWVVTSSFRVCPLLFSQTTSVSANHPCDLQVRPMPWPTGPFRKTEDSSHLAIEQQTNKLQQTGDELFSHQTVHGGKVFPRFIYKHSV